MSAAKKIAVELAVHTIESAIAAEAGGADRVELFSNPIEGGVTPSEGLITVARQKLARDIHVMIRPRGGDFHYSDLEFEAMRHDIAAAKRLGANGVVFGLVNLDGAVDVERTRRLVEAARPLSVTFHRAFDICQNLDNALEDLIFCGVERVLTSGGEKNAIDGIDTIAKLVRLAGNRIAIMAAGAIRAANLRQIAQATGMREVHSGLRSTVPSPMRFQNRKISFIQSVPDDYEQLIVTEEDVRKLVNEAGRV